MRHASLACAAAAAASVLRATTSGCWWTKTGQDKTRARHGSSMAHKRTENLGLWESKRVVLEPVSLEAAAIQAQVFHLVTTYVNYYTQQVRKSWAHFMATISLLCFASLLYIHNVTCWTIIQWWEATSSNKQAASFAHKISGAQKK